MEHFEHATLTVTDRDVALWSGSGVATRHADGGGILRGMTTLNELSKEGWQVVSSTLNSESKTIASYLLRRPLQQ